jgi:uncharacterized protein (TIGR01777 family)
MKNILIAGGSGFLGSALSTYFKEKGYQTKILTRKVKNVDDIYWDAKHLGDWIAEIEWADVLINMTGKSVNCRYTEKNKSLILSSRIDSTAILGKAIAQATNPPEVWLNASSGTTYIHSETESMTENNGIIGDDFSMNVCKKWEAEFFKHTYNQTRRVALRTTIVLGNTGGAFPLMKRLCYFLMGGKQGNGKQFVSWIHIADFCKAVEFVIVKDALVGPVNIVAPAPIRNTDFMKALRKSVKVPFGLGQPKWMLEIGSKIIGTETELLLKSRNVSADKLTDLGFKWDYGILGLAFQDLNS